ncbi:MAG: hypothetical protein ACI8PZ_003795 [Myxococcota bacterium]|jgi:hypothetical protein
MKWGLLLVLALTACSTRVRIRSQPTPVDILLPDGRRMLTPAQVVVRKTLFQPQLAEISAVGYRTVVIDLRRSGNRGDIFVVLVPEHGPAGSWSGNEAP